MPGSAKALAAAPLGHIGHFQRISGNKLVSKVGNIVTHIVTGVITGKRMLHSSAQKAFLGCSAYRIAGCLFQRHHAALQNALVTHLKVENGPTGVRASRIFQLGGHTDAFQSFLKAFLRSRIALQIDCLFKGLLHIRSNPGGAFANGVKNDLFISIFSNQGLSLLLDLFYNNW